MTTIFGGMAIEMYVLLRTIEINLLLRTLRKVNGDAFVKAILCMGYRGPQRQFSAE